MLFHRSEKNRIDAVLIREAQRVQTPQERKNDLSATTEPPSTKLESDKTVFSCFPSTKKLMMIFCSSYRFGAISVVSPILGLVVGAVHPAVDPHRSVVQPFEGALFVLVVIFSVVLRYDVRILLLQAVHAIVQVLVQGFRAGLVCVSGNAPPPRRRQTAVVVVFVVAFAATSHTYHDDYYHGDENQSCYHSY
jgi:hypothetical protein